MLRYRHEQEFYRTLLIATPPQFTKERGEAFDKYRAATFPHVVRHAVDTESTAKKILNDAVMRGPIVIRSLQDESG